MTKRNLEVLEVITLSPFLHPKTPPPYPKTPTSTPPPHPSASLSKYPKIPMPAHPSSTQITWQVNKCSIKMYILTMGILSLSVESVFEEIGRSELCCSSCRC
ncbi:unnamed protein product [Moneuplotes crassus]|uniref:Uncharacterized protein n=1 Tax=Euplotes crassus TaxID=5936 RepID=A0AAD1UCG8_EUPCR|nr:unnamed protein product [Moneuplotes crassus]